jgi:Xaa-Pro aminopeptidase
MTTRILSLQDRLVKLHLDALLFNTSEVVPSINVRYLSGFTGSDAAVLITESDRRLFTDGRYKTQASEEAEGFRVHVVRSRVDAVARSLKAQGVRRLGIEAGRVSYELVTALTRKVPELEPIPLNRKFVAGLRIKKSPEEKAAIGRAARIASEACAEVLKAGIVGKRESQVAADLETLFRHKGADGIAFETIVASGPRSALPHGAPSEKVISPGELVIVDFGCRREGYHSDETVTCITGKPSADQKKIYQAVHEAHMRALEAVKDGVRTRELDAVARRTIEKAGFGKYFLHGLGHGVGLEIHEPPSLSPRGQDVLEEGMVFTIEPGIYLEGMGGVRLESLVYLGRGGPEILSEMPKDLIPVH